MPKRNSRKAQARSNVPGLDLRGTLDAEHETQRMLWLLRVLLRVGRQRLPAVLQDCDVQAELCLTTDDLAESSPDAVRRWLERRLQQLEPRELAPDSLTVNVTWLAARLGLSQTQRKLLAFATTVEVSEALSVALKGLACRSSARAIQLLASLLEESVEEVRASLFPESPLMRSGMVQFRPEGDDYYSWIRVRNSFDVILTAHYERPEQLLETLCPRAPEAELSLGAYRHLSNELDLLISLLQGASLERARGVNVLLYGAPGCGKTQLVRSVAQVLQLPLHCVPDRDAKGQPLAGSERLNALSTIHSLLRGDAPALVVFDELEDAFPWQVEAGWLRKNSASAKAHTHRLLEENFVPCVWVGNRINQLDPACLRRFSLVIELPPPPLRARQELLSHYATGLDVPAELKTRLAENPWLTPAHAARAARVTRLVRRARSHLPAADSRASGRPTALSDAEVFERALRDGERSKPSSAQPALLEYDPALVNASVPLERLVRGLEQRGEGSVCLYGPPGTGKTAFARELAQRLQRPFVLRSAGDLLDRYVGGTERAIAEMFEEAARSGSVLLLDEAEGLLRDRRCAQQGWEVTQVNELLVRMEAFRGIFLCATNGFDTLDAASLRRFALRVEFSPLSGDQNLILVERTAQKLGVDFQARVARADLRRLARLTQLTPGDYAALLRGRLLIGESSVDSLVGDLERAEAEKRTARRVGFRP